MKDETVIKNWPEVIVALREKWGQSKEFQNEIRKSKSRQIKGRYDIHSKTLENIESNTRMTNEIRYRNP